MNNNIVEVKKKQKIGIIIINVLHIITFIILCVFASVMIKLSIKYIYILVFTIYLILLNIILYNVLISRYNKLLNVMPLECKIIDFVMFRKGRIDDKRYYICPILKDEISNKLYFTYINYDWSWYTSKYMGMTRSVISHVIFRKDKSEVKIGDSAKIYINRLINPKININKEEGFILLNKDKIIFNHPGNVNIEEFNNFNYFEGAIDVE